MNTPSRHRLLAGFLVAGSLALSPVGVRAEDAKTAEKPAATATARSKEKVIDDLNAAIKDLREVMGSKGPAAFADEKTRKEIAPKALPAMKKYLAAFDELAEQDPNAKEQAASVHGQFLAMMTTLGDADAE